MWVQKGRGKVVKSNILKTIFDNDFDIREGYSLNIQNMMKIYFLGFPT